MRVPAIFYVTLRAAARVLTCACVCVILRTIKCALARIRAFIFTWDSVLYQNRLIMIIKKKYNILLVIQDCNDLLQRVVFYCPARHLILP